MPYILKDSFFTFILSIIGILLLGTVPFLFRGTSFDFSHYSAGLMDLIKEMSRPQDIMYFTLHNQYSLFPSMWKIYSYSLTLIFSAFFIALVLGLVFAFLIYLLPSRLRDKIRVFSFVFESIPDVLIAIGMQFFIIWFFKKTNILLFQIVSLYDQKTYFVPIFCLTVLPALLILRIFLVNMEEEFNKPYIDTAKSKGIRRFRILWRHVLPNTLLSVLHQSRNILWLMLSNLLMVEFIFNIYGITSLARINGSPAIFTISMILLFVPIFLVFTVMRIAAYKWAGEK